MNRVCKIEPVTVFIPRKMEQRQSLLVDILQDTGSCSYNMQTKLQFHKLAKSVLRRIAKLMGLKSGEYDIRSNMAGIAVSGEITLHTERVYFQISQSCMGSMLYRSCSGRKDYTGGQNHFMQYEALLDLEKVANTLKLISA